MIDKITEDFKLSLNSDRLSCPKGKGLRWTTEKSESSIELLSLNRDPENSVSELNSEFTNSGSDDLLLVYTQIITKPQIDLQQLTLSSKSDKTISESF